MPSVLITGANRGIGLEFASSFARDGWHVEACCRSPDRAKDLKTVSGEVVIHRLDVTDGLQVASLARELAQTPIDLLINNSGIIGPSSEFGGTDYDDWLEVFRVNTLAPMRLVMLTIVFLSLLATCSTKRSTMRMGASVLTLKTSSQSS